jgi:hypothetical protein
VPISRRCRMIAAGGFLVRFLPRLGHSCSLIVGFVLSAFSG